MAALKVEIYINEKPIEEYEPESAAEREQNQLRFESAQRKLDKHLQGRKTPSRDGVVKLLKQKGR